MIRLTSQDPSARAYYDQLRDTRWLEKVVVGKQGASNQVKFITECVPTGTHVIVSDDNILEFVASFKASVTSSDKVMYIPTLGQIITEADKVMNKNNVSLWGVSPSSVYAKGTIEDPYACNQTLGLVYGAFFGMRTSDNSLLNCVLGDARDDVERTCRFMKYANGIVRFNAFSVVKGKKPGMWQRNAGGISGTMSEERYKVQSASAVQSLVAEFPDFLKPADNSTGYTWIRKARASASSMCSVATSTMGDNEDDDDSDLYS